MKLIDLPDLPEVARFDAQLIERGEYAIPLIESPRTVLDVGANVGLFSVWAKRRWPSSAIQAYEPLSSNAEAFRHNTEGLSDINLHVQGVRGFSGQSRMRTGCNQLQGSYHNGEGDAVETQCTDAASLTSADFVKLDCEGSEVEILERLDLSKTKAIAIEVHKDDDIPKVEALLKRAGLEEYDKFPAANGCSVLKYARPGAVSTKTKLFVAVPVYGGVEPRFMQSLMRLQLNPVCDMEVHTVIGDSLVSRARNNLTHQFLHSDCTDLLFIDSDLIFSEEQVARLISHDVDVCGGFYPKKQESDPVQWVCNAHWPNVEPREDGLQDLRYIGTGFMRVKKHVLKAMIKSYPECAYQADGDPVIQHDLWPVGVHKDKSGRSRYLSEDWYFCQRCLDLGFKVWGDTRIVLRHVGTAVYPLLTQVKDFMRAK